LVREPFSSDPGRVYSSGSRVSRDALWPRVEFRTHVNFHSHFYRGSAFRRCSLYLRSVRERFACSDHDLSLKTGWPVSWVWATFPPFFSSACLRGGQYPTHRGPACVSWSQVSRGAGRARRALLLHSRSRFERGRRSGLGRVMRNSLLLAATSGNVQKTSVVRGIFSWMFPHIEYGDDVSRRQMCATIRGWCLPNMNGAVFFSGSHFFLFTTPNFECHARSSNKYVCR